jgi:putative ABC transport system permease protein
VLKSYLAMAVRQLLAQKLYTAINVAGLALGVACTLLIALFVRHELSYDRQFANNERIVRISEDVAVDPPLHFAGSSPAIAPLLADFFPEVEKAARLRSCLDEGGGTLVTVGDRRFLEPRVLAVESEFFEIFQLDWQQGDARTAFASPDSVVLTESTARRYFGEAEGFGRTLQAFDGMDVPLVVTGIVSDLPDSTHLEFDLLLSLSAWPAESLTAWGGNCFHTYARLGDGANPAAIDSRSGEFFNQRFQDGSAQLRGFTAIPIRDIHLRSAREGELRTPGSLTTVYGFVAIAIFVLLIACINFVNLATARATQRAKEVGLRKAIGGTRAQLIRQFIGESLLLTVIGVGLAMIIVVAVLGPFARFVERAIGLQDVVQPEVMATIVAVTLLVGVGAGSYPAFLLSAFNPVRVLRGTVTRGTTAATFRKAFVVLQFAISITLIVATLVVFDQQRFAQSFDLGYEKDQIVVLTGSQVGRLGPRWESMKREFERVPGVEAVTASNVVPGARGSLRSQVRNLTDADNGGIAAQVMLVDFDFLATYDIDVIAGRAFTEASGDREITLQEGQPPPPPVAFVLSRLAVERLGSTADEFVGRIIEGPGGRAVVIGVVEDVYFESVRDPLLPVIYLVQPTRRAGGLGYASIRVTGADLERTLAGIDAVWSDLGPDVPILRRFLDDDFDALYRGERRQAQLLTAFSLLAIAIACLGLYGLASFSTMRRTKEIGIRKTLGAGVGDIVTLLTGEFGVLVVLANLIAWPVAYFAMQRWLSGFAYRIELGPFVFVESGLLVLVIATLTVAGVASRAARAKPVTALRYE